MKTNGVTLYDHRGNPIRHHYGRGGGGNRLIPPSRQNQDRKQVPLLDGDIHRNVSNHGRRTLLSLGRHIYWAYRAIAGAVEDIAENSSSTLLPEYRGKNLEWKALAEDLLYSHDRYCDIAGPPYNMRLYRKMLVRSMFMDGDMGTALIKDEFGNPYLQTIPGHRISSEEDIVEKGPFDGARIIDGVIVNDYQAAIAYRVLIGDGCDPENYQDIPATSMFLTFMPIVPGQVRGFSLLGVAAWDFQDLGEAKRWELLAQKAGAGRVFIERNEAGEPEPGSDHIVGPTSGTDGSGTAAGLWREMIDGGLNSYFKSNTNSSLEAVKFDRPSSNQQAFNQQVLRETFAGTGLSFDFHLDLTKLGGAPLRVLIDKINRSHRMMQDLVLEPSCRRFDAYRIPCFMEQKRLPFDPEWHKLEYQGPAELTADKKYDSDVDLQEVRMGVKTRARSAGQRGESLADLRNTKEAEVDDLFTRAKRISLKHGVPFEVAKRALEDDGDGGSPPAAQEQPEKPEKPE